MATITTKLMVRYCKNINCYSIQLLKHAKTHKNTQSNKKFDELSLLITTKPFSALLWHTSTNKTPCIFGDQCHGVLVSANNTDQLLFDNLSNTYHASR
jgi:hypothetical protein